MKKFHRPKPRRWLTTSSRVKSVTKWYHYSSYVHSKVAFHWTMQNLRLTVAPGGGVGVGWGRR